MSDASRKEELPAEIQLRVEDLSAFHGALARAFGEAQVGGARLHDLFANRIVAKCVGCGLTVTGEELGKIAVAGGEHPTVENKLDRFRLGYCGRIGCNSKFYHLRLDPAEGIVPSAILQRAKTLHNSPEPEPEPVVEEGPKVPWWKDRRKQTIAGAVALVALLGWRIFGPNGVAPIIKPSSPYQVYSNAPATYMGPTNGSLEVVQ